MTFKLSYSRKTLKMQQTIRAGVGQNHQFNGLDESPKSQEHISTDVNCLTGCLVNKNSNS